MANKTNNINNFEPTPGAGTSDAGADAVGAPLPNYSVNQISDYIKEGFWDWFDGGQDYRSFNVADPDGSGYNGRTLYYNYTGFTGTSLWVDLEAGCVVVLLSNRVHLVAKRSRFTLRPLVHDLIREAFLAA